VAICGCRDVQESAEGMLPTLPVLRQASVCRAVHEKAANRTLHLGSTLVNNAALVLLLSYADGTGAVRLLLQVAQLLYFWRLIAAAKATHRTPLFAALALTTALQASLIDHFADASLLLRFALFLPSGLLQVTGHHAFDDRRHIVPPSPSVAGTVATTLYLILSAPFYFVLSEVFGRWFRVPGAFAALERAITDDVRDAIRDGHAEQRKH
jgi:uncharacterized membrane protein YGL010W